MAEQEPFGDEKDLARDESLPCESTNGDKPKRHGGGPRTPEGKRAVAQNALKHGIFSKSPVVGHESEDEWQDHLDGTIEFIGPLGYEESRLVRELALNRWRRQRLDCYETELIQSRLEEAEATQPDDGEKMVLSTPPHMRPRLWCDFEAVASLIESFEDIADETPIDGEVMTGLMLALERSGAVERTTWAPRLPEGMRPDDFEGWTVSDARFCVNTVATHRGVDKRTVLDDATITLGVAASDLCLRGEKRQREYRRGVVEASLLPANELDQVMRYGSHLDHGYERIMKRLEILQRARNGTIPPPIRIEVNES